MKKIYILITCFFLMLGCTTSENNTTDTSNGPVVKEDSQTNEEKILSMIASRTITKMTWMN